MEFVTGVITVITFFYLIEYVFREKILLNNRKFVMTAVTVVTGWQSKIEK